MQKLEILNRVETLLDRCNSGEKMLDNMIMLVSLTEALNNKDYPAIVAVLDGYECVPAVEPRLAQN